MNTVNTVLAYVVTMLRRGSDDITYPPLVVARFAAKGDAIAYAIQRAAQSTEIRRDDVFTVTYRGRRVYQSS